MAIISVAPIPKKSVNARRLLARLCYYYPQYTLADARKLAARDVALLLDAVHQETAINYLNLTQIAAAPHTKKGSGVTKLISKYKQVANG